MATIPFAYHPIYIYLHIPHLHKPVACIATPPHLHKVLLRSCPLFSFTYCSLKWRSFAYGSFAYGSFPCAHSLTPGGIDPEFGEFHPKILGISPKNLRFFSPKISDFLPQILGFFLSQILGDFGPNFEEISSRFLNRLESILKFSPQIWNDFFPPKF